ncbi:pleiotropic drug resistance protein 2-like [Forsythia ovata]|uniref:Pleiotropic drug resistance protein 2-like n=1 Tax=Forsythia ovata TaxID=205694 RepID=A0ABD1TAT1_9LAMI
MSNRSVEFDCSIGLLKWLAGGHVGRPLEKGSVRALPVLRVSGAVIGEMSKRRKKRDEDEALSEGDEPPKKSSKLSAAAVDNDSDKSDHIVVCELSKNRKVFGKSWNGRVVVDIREFYYKDGKEMTGKKDKFARKGPLRCYREGSFSQQKDSRGRKELKTDKEKKFHQDSTKYLLPSSDLKGNHANHMHDSLWQLRVLPPTFEGKQVLVVAIERTVFYREKAAGMYSALPCAFAQEISIWWRWYYSPVAWTIYGLVTSQVGDQTDPVEVPGLGDIPLKDYLKSFIGFEHDYLGAVAAAHVAWHSFSALSLPTVSST